MISTPVGLALAGVDQFLEKARAKSAAAGRPVKCAKGCFHCCKEPVMALRDEARNLLTTLSPVALAEVKERTAAWWDKYFASKMNRQPCQDDWKGPGNLLAYRAQNLWCPLLKDGLCTVYDQRPVGCRMHNAVGSPTMCADDVRRASQKFMQTDQDGAAMFAALGEMCENAPQALFEFDNLGVWLAHELLGKTERSAAARDMLVRQTDTK